MFEWWKTLTNSSDTVGKVTDAVINTGDKLFYTDEEKAEMRIEYSKQLPNLLKAYEPFKIAQRVLSFWFAFLFGTAFLFGLGMVLTNIYIKFSSMKEGVPLDKIVYLDVSQLYGLVNSFSLGYIMLTIVAFYYGGGFIESTRRKVS